MLCSLPMHQSIMVYQHKQVISNTPKESNPKASDHKILEANSPVHFLRYLWTFSFNKPMVSPAVWHVALSCWNHKSVTLISWIFVTKNSLIMNTIKWSKSTKNIFYWVCRYGVTGIIIFRVKSMAFPVFGTDFGNKFPQFVNVVQA